MLFFSPSTDRYNPSNLPILEDYLYDQVRRGTYDAMANLATLKLLVFGHVGSRTLASDTPTLSRV